jgi:hypothetical protein
MPAPASPAPSIITGRPVAGMGEIELHAVSPAGKARNGSSSAIGHVIARGRSVQIATA